MEGRNKNIPVKHGQPPCGGCRGYAAGITPAIFLSLSSMHMMHSKGQKSSRNVPHPLGGTCPLSQAPLAVSCAQFSGGGKQEAAVLRHIDFERTLAEFLSESNTHAVASHAPHSATISNENHFP